MMNSEKGWGEYSRLVLKELETLASGIKELNEIIGRFSMGKTSKNSSRNELNTKDVLKNRDSFSARGAGIMGMMNFGRDHQYLLNEEMEIDFDVVESFLSSQRSV